MHGKVPAGGGGPPHAGSSHSQNKPSGNITNKTTPDFQHEKSTTLVEERATAPVLQPGDTTTHSVPLRVDARTVSIEAARSSYSTSSAGTGDEGLGSKKDSTGSFGSFGGGGQPRGMATGPQSSAGVSASSSFPGKPPANLLPQQPTATPSSSSSYRRGGAAAPSHEQGSSGSYVLNRPAHLKPFDPATMGPLGATLSSASVISSTSSMELVNMAAARTPTVRSRQLE
ncbi:unnamed protein product, partial [Amoebophrya sp. A120]